MYSTPYNEQYMGTHLQLLPPLLLSPSTPTTPHLQEATWYIWYGFLDVYIITALFVPSHLLSQSL